MTVGVGEREGANDSDTVGFMTSVVAQIKTSAPPVTVVMGGRVGSTVTVAKGVTRSAGLMTSVVARIRTSAPSVAVAMGGREGATVTAAVVYFCLA